MSQYQAPIEDLLFNLIDVLDITAENPDLPPETVCAIIEEAARFNQDLVAPTNKKADQEGTSLQGKGVITAAVLAGIYEQYCAGGWPGLTGQESRGGQGLPYTLGFAVDEMLQSANLAFSLLPMLTQGVITALSRYGSTAQQALYLPRLVSGQWSGTMNLTEPQAGTDLGLIKTTAERQGDHYLLTGQKIFITWGDHSYAENIIHLVLARTPEAPAGVKGISLFIVPKFVVSEDGELGERNRVFPIGVEHKLGIHASPTCTMQYGEEGGGAIGYLVGEENQGLKYMFAMMNHARLAVGLQGVSVSERACQSALAYARERIQGGASIIEHADVRRMYLTMVALTQAGRALTLAAMKYFDAAKVADSALSLVSQQRVDLLTPLVKGWCTEIANEVTSLAIQIHGGMGYIEETGVAQLYRDARITSIYEGTNGIQAMDLVGRKLLANGGVHAAELFEEMGRIVEKAQAVGLQDLADSFGQALQRCSQAVKTLLQNATSHHDYAGSVAHPLLMLLGTTVAGCYLLQGAVKAQQLLDSDDKPFYHQKIQATRVFSDQILNRTLYFEAVIAAGCENLDSGYFA